MPFFKRVLSAFSEHKVPFAVVGGYAVVLHGVIRGTADIDLVVNHSKEVFERTEKALESIGFKSRLPLKANEVFEFRDEYIKNRNLIAWSFYNPSHPLEIVDIILTHDRKNLKVMHKTFQGKRLPVVEVTSLIKMKQESGRPQDLEDIKALQEITKEQS